MLFTRISRVRRSLAIDRRLAVTLLLIGGTLAAPAWAEQPAPEPRAFLGAFLEAADEGMRVTRVTPGAPSDRHGIVVGDLLVSLDGVDLAPIDGPEVFAEQFGYLRPGDRVPLVVRSGDETRTIDFELGTEPATSVARRRQARGRQAYQRSLERLWRYAEQTTAKRKPLGIRIGADGPASLASPQAGIASTPIDATLARSLAALGDESRKALGEVEEGDCLRFWFTFSSEVLRVERYEISRAAECP